MSKRQLSFVSLILIAALSLIACSQSAVTTVLEAVITTTSAAVDIAFPQAAAQLNPYFTQVSNFVDQVSTELATMDTPAQKAAIIAQDAAKIAAPNLSGLTGEIVTRIGAIAPLIAQLVSEIQSLSAGIDSTPGGAQAFFAAKGTKPPTSAGLAKIRAKNAALKAKIAAAKH